ncbi:MAG: hydroxymethylbilane synthase [Phycisphaerae bacterium]|nr:hydroxymethylbilane synthase [Phycisphaerae bacterium]
MLSRYRIGTRGSKLALAQTQLTINLLRSLEPQADFTIEIIASRGDIHCETPIQNLGEQGLFTAELEKQLLDGRVDIVVHSAKDLPTQMPAGLTIAAYSARIDPREVLISRDNIKLTDLPPGARIGTSSPRRKTQLAQWRSDLTFTDIRGNVDTRIRKVRQGDYQATIMAHAGLLRLNLDNEVAEVFSPEMILPAAGQGALALQCRRNDQRVCSLLSLANHEPTAQCVRAERRVLKLLEAGCSCPIGVLAGFPPDTSTPKNRPMMLRACRCDPETNARIDAHALGPAEDWQTLAQQVADRLRNK